MGLKKELHDEVQYKVNKAIAKHKVRTHVYGYTGVHTRQLRIEFKLSSSSANVCVPMQLGSSRVWGVVHCM